ncbi:MAG: hypothetical protein IIC10_07970 [Proteobacteria bacterium]|nr:hypothetical protein [Pseudomonadota bacterium]
MPEPIVGFHSCAPEIDEVMAAAGEKRNGDFVDLPTNRLKLGAGIFDYIPRNELSNTSINAPPPKPVTISTGREGIVKKSINP